MSHLYKLGLENFRVFKEYTEIEFAPITILTGANNSGKSSVVKALYLLKDNLFENNLRVSPPLFKGKLGFLNEHHKLGQYSLVGNNPSEPLNFTLPIKIRGINDLFKLSLSFENDDSNDLGNAKLVEMSLNRTTESLLVFKYSVVEETARFYIDYKYFFLEFEKIIVFESSSIETKIKIERDKAELLKSGSESEDSQDFFHRGYLFFSPIPFMDFSKYKRGFDKILESKIESKESNMLSGLNFIFFLISKKVIDFKELKFIKNVSDPIYNYLKSHIDLDDITFKQLVEEFNEKLFEDLINESETIRISKDDIIDQGELIPDIINYLLSFDIPDNYEGEVLYENNGFRNLSSYNTELTDEMKNFFWTIVAYEDFYIEKDKFLFFLKNFMANALSEIMANASFNFKKLYSLDAVRSNTQRLYTYKSQGTYFNEELQEFLDRNLNKDKQVMEFIQKWITIFGCDGELSFSINKQGVGVSIAIGGRSLADYGYGMTQLLPILIKIACIREQPLRKKDIDSDFLRQISQVNEEETLPGTTLIIEEPETNLHPKFQSLLADLFIDANKQFNIQFVIETHSEYLIRKLQYLTAKKEILPSDTSIYYFHNPNKIPIGEKQVKKIEIREDGRLSDKFGSGFFDEADNMAMELFLLNQIQSN